MQVAGEADLLVVAVGFVEPLQQFEERIDLAGQDVAIEQATFGGGFEELLRRGRFGR